MSSTAETTDLSDPCTPHSGMTGVENRQEERNPLSVLILFHTSQLNSRTELHAETLSESGYNVEAICWNRSIENKNQQKDSIPTSRIATPGKIGTFSNIIYLPFLYMSIIYAIWGRKTDVLYCPHISLLPVAVLVSVLKDSSLIYDAQEIYLEDYANRESSLSSLVSWISTKMEASLLMFADGILTIDTMDDLLYERYNSHTGNIKILYNVPNVAPEEISTEPKKFVQERRFESSMSV